MQKILSFLTLVLLLAAGSCIDQKDADEFVPIEFTVITDDTEITIKGDSEISVPSAGDIVRVIPKNEVAARAMWYGEFRVYHTNDLTSESQPTEIWIHEFNEGEKYDGEDMTIRYLAQYRNVKEITVAVPPNLSSENKIIAIDFSNVMNWGGITLRQPQE